MPRKKTPAQWNAKQKKIRAGLMGSFPIKDCRGVGSYISKLMEAHINDAITKEQLNGGVYAGAILLQAIKLSKDEFDTSELMPDNLKTGSIEMGTDRSETIAFLTASQMSVQVKLLKRGVQEGKIINVQAEDVSEEAIEAAKPPIKDRVAGLIRMAQGDTEEDQLFAEE